VDFDGEPPRVNVPRPIDGETFAAWKNRILGPEVENIVLYVPYQPVGQTKLSSLQNRAEAKHIKKMFRDFRRTKNTEKDEAIQQAWDNAWSKIEEIENEMDVNLDEHNLALLERIDDNEQKIQYAVTEVERRYDTFTMDTLKDLIDSFDGNLEISVQDFLVRLTEANELNTEDLIKTLISAYNSAVRLHR